MNLKDNPFAALLASQITPGAGLYIGLFGGIIVAVAFSLIALPLLRAVNRRRYFYISQSCALVLAILLATTIGPGSRKGNAHLPRSANNSPPLSVPQAQAISTVTSPPQIWHIGQPVAIGDATVTVVSSEIGLVPLKSLGGDSDISVKPALMIKLALVNTSATRILNYHPYAPPQFGRSHGATLEDDLGNVYRPIGFGFETKIVGQVRHSKDLYPGKNIEDLLVFQPPVTAAKTLTLQIEGSRVGGHGTITFTLPAH